MKLIISALALTFALPAFANHHGKGHGKDGHGHHGIGKDMKKIAKSYEQLGGQIDNQAKNKDSVKLVDHMIMHSEKAMKHAPKDATKAEKFKTDMATMITHLNGMKTALLADDNAQAKTHFDWI